MMGVMMMEILSTGEKIKRARVYKGSTLKDICEDKISVSKMSCIENNKVKAERWILELVADKLELDTEYLLRDVREQIEDNIKKLSEERFSKELEKSLNYNLEYAIEYRYFDLAFQIMHILFDHYLDRELYENIQVMISKYYEVCQKSGLKENIIIYNRDMTRYFYCNKEYTQAATYARNTINILTEYNINDVELIAMATYNEAICNAELGNFNRVYELFDEIKNQVEHIGDKNTKANIYNFLADIALKRGDKDADYYEEQCFKYYDDNEDKVYAYLNSASVLLGLSKREKGIEYVNKAIELSKAKCEEKINSVLIRAVKELVDNNILDEAVEKCDEALNYAISSDDIKLIEKAYYYKAKILQKYDKYSEAEMYMNLSLDALLKFASKKELYKRYLEMGHMYFRLEETREALKYFDLAMKIEKKF